MKVFLSWSGDKSKFVAEALRGWLRKVIQAIDPWLSSEDVEKGSRWGSEIAAKLNESDAGIICVTPDSLDSRWLNFEAGALSKSIKDIRVATYLIGLKPTDIEGPLVQFQASEANAVDTLKLMKTINRGLGDHSLPESELAETFHLRWPELEAKLKEAGSLTPSTGEKRTDREILEEILSLVRASRKVFDTLSRYLATPDFEDAALTSDWLRKMRPSGKPETGYDRLLALLNLSAKATFPELSPKNDETEENNTAT